MSRADYSHWNEEQDIIWWEEEGKHQDEPNDPDDESWRDEPDDHCVICDGSGKIDSVVCEHCGGDGIEP